MLDPLQRLRDRALFASDSATASIVRASTLVRPVFANRKEPEAEGGLPGLFQPALHEVYGATADQPALVGFGLGVLHNLKNGPVLWVRQEFLDGETGRIFPSGLREYGVDPKKIILVQAGNARELLQAGLEAARCKALAGALLEFAGDSSLYDLTASRRLTLAAQSSGVRLIFLRSATQVVPSAAETRWHVRALASSPLASNAPGKPVFEAELLRSRRGAEPKIFVLEWNPDAGEFEERTMQSGASSYPAAADQRTASLSGAVVSFPVYGQAASGGKRRAG